MMMTKQKTSLAERLNIGDDVRELKLGSTFNPKNTSTAFHTIKYDFKPASVDTGRMATVDVGSNNQVTVTVPNLESSGVPHTVFKGNHRKYTKECLIIYDKETGAFTLEKLNHNIQVKKTRSEMTNKASFLPAGPTHATNAGNVGPMPNGIAPTAPSGSKLENSTMRISSKTKVSTGSRRNNIIDFKPRHQSPMQQSSPSRPVAIHRSPQSAPAWHANNNQQTLPSIPMIVDDDDFGLGAALHNGGQANTSGSSTNSSIGQPDYGQSTHMVGKQRQGQHGHAKRQQQMTQRLSPPMQQQQNNYGRGYNYAHQQQQQQQQRHSPPAQQQQQQHHHHHQQQQQQQQQHHHHQRMPISQHSNNMPMSLDSPPHNDMTSQSVAHAAAVLEQQIGGALSASSSSSDSDSSDSDSGSDSDDSSEDDRPTQHQHQQPQQHQQHLQHQSVQQHMPQLGLGSISPAYNNHHNQLEQHHQQQQQQSHHQHQQQQQQQQSNMFASNGGFPSDFLQNDLQLSSNSSDDDDD